MDFMPLRLNSSSLTCSICALATIILQLVVMECQKLHMVDSPVSSCSNDSCILSDTRAVLHSGNMEESYHGKVVLKNGLIRFLSCSRAAKTYINSKVYSISFNHLLTTSGPRSMFRRLSKMRGCISIIELL